MNRDEVESRIAAAVEANFERQVALTADLVRLPSQRGEEALAQSFMADAYAERGLDVDRWKVDVADIQHMRGFSPVGVSYADAYNVVGTWRPAQAQGRSLILNGHIDVVPTGPLGRWGLPPYEPRVLDGWMHGRGAGDMKAGLVACLAALDAVRSAGYAPASTIHLQSVIEEECTGNGALACLQRGYRADAAIIPEPMTSLVRAQVGTLWFTVHVRGDPAHASGAFEAGANAIEKAYVVIQALKALEIRWNACKAQVHWFREHPHPIRFNVGKIVGGEWASSVPAQCDLHVRCAIYPGWDIDRAKREICEWIAKATRHDPFLASHPPVVAFNDGFHAEGFVLEPGSAAETTFRDCHQAVTGTPLAEQVTAATTDARFFGLYQDTPALVYGPLARNIHGFDEAVNLESLRKVTQVMALFIARWCGVRAA